MEYVQIKLTQFGEANRHVKVADEQDLQDRLAFRADLPRIEQAYRLQDTERPFLVRFLGEWMIHSADGGEEGTRNEGFKCIAIGCAPQLNKNFERYVFKTGLSIWKHR